MSRLPLHQGDDPLCGELDCKYKHLVFGDSQLYTAEPQYERIPLPCGRTYSSLRGAVLEQQEME